MARSDAPGRICTRQRESAERNLGLSDRTPEIRDHNSHLARDSHRADLDASDHGGVRAGRRVLKAISSPSLHAVF